MRLLLLLGAELCILIALASLGDLRRHVPLFLGLFAGGAACWLLAALVAMRSRLPMPIIILVAVGLRLPMFFAQPSLSDDVWRYIHDGRAQNAGVNPYAYAPVEPGTATFRGAEYARINHPELRTIYPPAAQYAFRISTLFATPLLAWRLLMLAAELVIILAGARLLRQRGHPPANLALYAWHPLAIIESIGSAHVEPLGIALLILALANLATARPLRAGVALAASVAAKLIAAPLLLLTIRNRRLLAVFGATLFALYLPFLFRDANVFGSLAIFAESWASNGSVYVWLSPLLGELVYRWVAAAVLIAALVLLHRQRRQLEASALLYILVLFLLSPVVHPWYLLWVLALVSVRSDPFDAFGSAAVLWTATVAAAYVAHQNQLTTGVWQIPGIVLVLEYAPVYVLLLYGVWTARKTWLRFSMTSLAPSSVNTAAKM